MRAIADELSLAGLATRLHESRASVDVTATLTGSGRREAEVIVDEDAYVEMRFWHDPQATPAQVAALITSALAAVTGGRRA
jgi:hypothetical protein